MAETAVPCVLQKPRHVVRKFLARPQHEGDGAVVRRSIGRFELRYFDPFLVLDEFSGHKGTVKAGDLQWMTAGRGIVHSEMPAGKGTSKGLQLWVNLSSKNKM
ncbi:hypothetical protein BHM03_00052852 [Ensete ventricosum]|nr:hypothetical protein BHM03_00052852 [Ensete ventricosum]